MALNVDGAEHDQDRTGATTLRLTAEQRTEFADKARRLVSALTQTQLANKQAVLASVDAAVARGAVQPSDVRVRVTREGLVALAHNELVRALIPVGFVDSRPRTFDPEVVQTARASGSADVIVSLRSPIDGRAMSEASRGALSRSVQRSIDSVLADARVDSKVQPCRHRWSTAKCWSASRSRYGCREVESSALRAASRPQRPRANNLRRYAAVARWSPSIAAPAAAA